MKTKLKKNYGSRATRLTPRRIPLTPPRKTKRQRDESLPPTSVLPITAPTPETREIDPTPPAYTDSPRDALQLYLREIGQVKLLTPQEELALARRIKRGDKAAREHMIKANLRLVVKIARDYEGLGLPLLDLINGRNMTSAAPPA